MACYCVSAEVRSSSTPDSESSGNQHSTGEHLPPPPPPPPPPQINQPSLNTLAFQQQDVCMLFCSPSLHLSVQSLFLLFQITVNVTLINFCVFSASAVFSLTRSSEIIKICCSINICYYYYDVENSRVELFSGFLS